MRRKLIAGNWKMNGSLAALAELDAIAAAAADCAAVDVAICPPATLIAPAAARRPGLPIGAQDCAMTEKGAHTGCISAAMVREAGATLVIVGHSERRAGQNETDADVRAKAQAAIGHGLTAILCVGESEAQRDAGDALATVAAQIDASVPDDVHARAATGNEPLVIAYEPIWAIGTGRVPGPADVAEMHGAIRSRLTAKLGRDAAAATRILYGGSMNADNAAELLAIPDVDGGLIGGASLTAAAFVPIIHAAQAVG